MAHLDKEHAALKQVGDPRAALTVARCCRAGFLRDLQGWERLYIYYRKL